MYKTYIHYVYMGNHIHIAHSRAQNRGEEGQDSDIQTMRSEEQVAEEFGSWHEYMELQRQVPAGRSWKCSSIELSGDMSP